MKRIFTILFVAMLAGQVLADDFTVGTLKYTVTDETKHYVSVGKGSTAPTDTLNILEKVTNPDDSVEYTVTSIRGSAFSGCSSLTSITIPNSVTSIGNNAFYGCSSLTSITIPDSITSIGGSTFYNCRKLTSVSIPNTVTSIGDFAFVNCSKLTSITIPDSVTYIGKYAFCGCSGLTSVTIPNSVMRINEAVFLQCSGLTSVSIGNSVTYIGKYAFNDCSGLTSITIPNSVTSIGYSAFYGCSSLTSITIPNSVTYIGEYAFEECSKLTKINVGNDNSAYLSEDGVLFNKDKTKIICYPVGKTETTYTIPNSVTTIVSGAFGYCSKLTSIIIPNSVTSIGRLAFGNCSGLTSVIIPNSVTKIDSSAFCKCSGLTSVTIGNSVKTINYRAFYACSITTVSIPNSVTSIGDDVFYESRKLTEINVESDNTKYSSVDGVLFNKDTTTLICYPQGKTETTYTFPNSITRIRNRAFQGCESLTSVTIPNSVTSIEEYAFYDCSGLTSVAIPKSVTKISVNAFEYCNNATFNCEHKAKPNGWTSGWCPSSATVIWQELDATDPDYPELAVNVDDFTFEITSSVEPYTAKITGYTGTNPNVVLPRKVTIDGKVHAVTELSANVFDNNKIIMAVYIPNTITSVGSKAFNENYELTIYCEANCDFETHPAGWANNWFGKNNSYFSVVGNTIVAGWYIYQIYNTSNRKLTIQRYIGHENQVTVRDTAIINSKYYYADSIAYQAFWRCDSIKELTISKAFTKIANYAFMYCDSLKKLTYNTNAIGSTFANHRSLKQIEIGDNVTSVANWAFGGCSDLEEVTFGKSVKTVGNNAFAGCSKLKKVDFPSIKSLCKIKFDIYESNPMEITHSLYINGEEVVDVYIPNTVSSIGSRAFSGCSNLTSVCIPKSVNSIGEKTFLNCSNLTIFCEAASQPNGWNENWNPDNRPVVWSLYTDKKIRHAIVTSGNNEYGSVEGSGYLIDSTETTITATPAQGYHFTSWSDNNIDNPRVIKATSDTLLTAMFEAHTIVVDSAVAATCTESGLTEGSHCSVCGDTLIAQKTVSAKGHTSVTDAAIAATCTEPGLAEGSHCSVCGEVIVAQTEIPALGHEFVNYIYNNDATTEADGTETADCERGCGETDTRVKEGTKLPKDNTAVIESAANAVNIYAHGNTIVVENATEDIFVYNAMGALVCKEAIHRVSATITVNNSGVYIVKTGSTVKRVMVN